MDPFTFERGDAFYIVTKCAPIKPSDAEVDEFAFSKQLRSQAPNENIMWLRGQYVEADNANANGHIWTSGELAIKSLTPVYMPVTVMHDPRSAVGLIADARLVTPAKDAVPRARIDTQLAIWAHRFPEVAEECMANYESGDLMQSMECRSPSYACAECGQEFAKLPPFASDGIGKERAQWCAHLNENGRRILQSVVFTGTGLIFGTRGARGANDKAHLEVFQEEVAEYHEKSHRDTGKKKQTRRKNFMEIEDRRYEELLAAENTAKRVPDLEQKLADAETAKAEADAKVETAEAAKVKADEEKAELQTKVDAAEENANKQTLAKDRLDKLGSGFKAKIDKIESVKAKLDDQAQSMSDDDWTARVEELAELTGVKSDAKLKKDENADEEDDAPDDGAADFSAEELAKTHAASGWNGGGGGHKSKEVVSGLFAQTAPGSTKTTE